MSSEARPQATSPTSPVQTLLDIPFHRFLGLELADPAEPSAGVRLHAGTPTMNNQGLLHGGIVYALLDVAAYLALLPVLAGDERTVTHDVFVSLMRSVRQDQVVHVLAQLTHRGRSIAFLSSEAVCEGRVVAVGRVTKSVLPGERP